MFSSNCFDTNTWQAAEEAVLCFVRDESRKHVLLIHKKTGLGAGLINAPGGRIEAGETPSDAAIRETEEEVCLKVSNPEHRGDLFFEFSNGHTIRGYVFETNRWKGSPKETREAKPFWCSEDAIPFQKMWVDDSWWIPHLLDGNFFQGCFFFDNERMLGMSLHIKSAENSEIQRNRIQSQETKI